MRKQAALVHGISELCLGGSREEAASQAKVF